MVIAMVVVCMVQVPINQIVDMTAVRDLLMSAIRAMLVLRFVAFA